MSNESTSSVFETFLDELRRVLQHLYDPRELRRSPLLTLLVVQDRGNPTSALRQLLINAIQVLKPEADIPTHSNVWRFYHILTYRYVEQSDQKTVANNVGLSVRQLRRQERRAEQALADYLWTRYSLQHQAEVLFSSPPLSDKQIPTGNAGLPGRERELEWMRDSFPSEVTDVSAIIEATLKTVGPLVRMLEVHVVCEIPEGLPPVTGQRVLLQHAFLSLLTAAMHAMPGGQVRVSAELQEEGIVVCLEAENGEPSGADSSGVEHLQMARQCIDLFGGELSVKAERDQSFATALLLPVTEPVPILVIDDNLDTLHLFQRYLLGTRYQFFGVHDPEEALSVAESVLPEVIVLDVMLPEIDGWELLGRLREHPVMQALPIIVCTVMPQEQLALALGAADYLRKPVSREKLLSTLDRQVNSRRTRSG